jgi:hypothetical protein
MAVNQKAAGYIRTQLDAGFSIDSIEKAMKEAGWDPQEIEDAIDQVVEEKALPEDERTPQEAEYPAFPQDTPRPAPPNVPRPLQASQAPAPQPQPSAPAGTPGVSLPLAAGFGLAFAGGVACLNRLVACGPAWEPGTDMLPAGMSFSALLGDAGVYVLLAVIAAVIACSLAALVLKGARMAAAPLIIVLSALLVFNGFLVGPLLGIAGGALILLSRQG